MVEDILGKYRKNITPGLGVGIIQDQDRKRGTITKGIVKEILTRSSEHPYGIKVKLVDGSVGRVQEIFGKEETEGKEIDDKLSLIDSDILDQLIISEESEILEFKESLKWDNKKGQANKDLPREIMREIVAFLNNTSNKKILLIGVSDDHTIKGIDKDLKTWCHGSRDVFEQTLANFICKYIGPEYDGYIHTQYLQKNKKTICALSIEFSYHDPAFYRGDKGNEFWLRVKNTKQTLDSKAATNYIMKTWK